MMKTASIITVGSEIIEGIILNTNEKYICYKLTEAGLKVIRTISVDDDIESIKNAVNYSLNDSDVIVLSGGLGPTEDDKTREAIAESLKLKIALNEELKKAIEKRISKYHRYVPSNIAKQAMVIENAKILENHVGSAPGQLVFHKGKILVLLPGPPQELEPMLNNALNEIKPQPDLSTLSMLFFSIPEAELDEIITSIVHDTSVKIATQASYFDGVRVRLSAPKAKAEELTKLSKKIIELTGEKFIGYGNITLEEAVIKLLKKKHQTLSIAESCTGGMISSRLVNIPGASEVFLGAIVAYNNSVKRNILNVSNKILEKYGAVSQQCVAEMAEGVRKIMKSDLALAVSGIAGPTGGSEKKPVGTVYFCIAGESIKDIQRLFYPQQRNVFRSRVSAYGLYLILKCLSNML
ncbi:competence/damage-inducible protein A [Pseudothermotoga lettingae]|jgi:nicotinamide-nucleotide amidase|nr:competence/damage-inducible protein A [Pseudothermotoga lettingae]ABV33198.1 competence/damage-inducible protein CinA [Pseudothermotoga lettingae TMO]KUK20048.1 MAG: CinA-like protein [Pseudothermotoga lettingae]MDK2884203.1 nicotinamide-nucleotide amidase [Pseudothermotoga sp.]HBJ81604.1 competence/damage-inducible protein A [Pseudothermotoga sp.]